MNVCNPMAVRAFAPALVGWCLALAAGLGEKGPEQDAPKGIGGGGSF